MLTSVSQLGPGLRRGTESGFYRGFAKAGVTLQLKWVELESCAPVRCWLWPGLMWDRGAGGVTANSSLRA